jgi:hypothetical protein
LVELQSYGARNEIENQVAAVLAVTATGLPHVLSLHYSFSCSTHSDWTFSARRLGGAHFSRGHSTTPRFSLPFLNSHPTIVMSWPLDIEYDTEEEGEHEEHEKHDDQYLGNVHR